MHTNRPEAKNNKSQSEPFLLLQPLIITNLILEGRSYVGSLCRLTTQLTNQTEALEPGCPAVGSTWRPPCPSFPVKVDANPVRFSQGGGVICNCRQMPRSRVTHQCKEGLGGLTCTAQMLACSIYPGFTHMLRNPQKTST